MTVKFKFASLLCAAGLISAVQVTPAEAQSTIRACANPAGQLRLIGPTDSCKSQETLVTWNGAGAPGPAGPTGPAGPAGPQGLPGDDAQGVVGGADRGPAPGDGPASLSGTPFPLTTENIATGFPGYMVWANVALEFNSGNPTAAIPTLPSPPGAGCSLTYTVAGRVGTFFVDSRPVTFPIVAFGQNDRVVRLAVGLTGLVGKDLTPALLPTETVDITLACNSPGFVPPAAGPQPVPVKVVSWSLSGIGVASGFQ